MKTEALLTSHMLGPLKPRKKEYTLYDAGCPGLAIRVQPSGGMSWVTWQRSGQTTRRITLGKYPDLDVAAARAALHAFIAGGTMPAVPACPSFAEITALFLKAKQGVYQKDTLYCMQTYLDSQLLPAFGKLRLNRITTPQVAA